MTARLTMTQVTFLSRDDYDTINEVTSQAATAYRTRPFTLAAVI